MTRRAVYGTPLKRRTRACSLRLEKRVLVCCSNKLAAHAPGQIPPLSAEPYQEMAPYRVALSPDDFCFGADRAGCLLRGDCLWESVRQTDDLPVGRSERGHDAAGPCSHWLVHPSRHSNWPMGHAARQILIFRPTQILLWASRRAVA
jgi:hypothetical protein